MATEQAQLAAQMAHDPDSGAFYVYVPERRLYVPLSTAAGLATEAGVATSIAAALAGDITPASMQTAGLMSGGSGSVGGTAFTGDGSNMFVEGSQILVAGAGYFRVKGITRIYSGTSVAIAADTRAVLIRGVGGGGGGGGAQGGVSGAAAGAGGGGGAYFEAWKEDVAGQSLTCAIGAAGAAGANTGGNGGTGGDTTILNGSLWEFVAEGGTGGYGQSNDTFGQFTSSGYGQNATGGDLNVGGEAGSPGFRLNATNNFAGKGGSSRFGAGGAAFAGNAAGQQGLGHGAGGGGAAVASNATGRAGGAGSAGYIEIMEFA